MKKGDLIYAVISLLVLFYIIMGPKIKKIFPSPTKPPSSRGEETKLSNEIAQQEILRNKEETRRPPLSKREVPHTLISQKELPKEELSSFEKIEELSPLKRALIWSEILSKPPGY
ncbi:MAG: hypothetical protein PQJ59_07395 [Spirochaetales bacterium]|nr:hypothetical protein [Spirochaetales bacterium]